MNKIATESRSPDRMLSREPASDWEDDAEAEDFKPLTREQAVRWRASQPRLSIGWVLVWQVVVGVLVGALAIGLSGMWTAGVSAWYGAFSIVGPAAVMALGVTRGRLSRVMSTVPKGSLATIVFWEGLKVGLSVMLLAASPWILKQVDWLALLAGLVVVVKVNGVALWWMSRSPRKVN